MSEEPLSAEQIAVYRVVLEDYLKDTHGSLNLARRTEPMVLSDLLSDETCTKAIALQLDKDLGSVVHNLGAAMLPSPNVVLVDPDRQKEKIKQGDPQELIRRAVDRGERVTEEELQHSVKKAFENGLFTLSEIVFDKQHQHAVVAYSFFCGMLCGHGSTVLLERVGGEWRVSKRCGEWVS